MKIHNKLVRDNIVELVEKRGKKCNYRVATLDDEYEKYLRLKLIEEAHELLEEPCAAEIGDVLDVIDAMMEFYGIDYYTMETDRMLKKNSRGGFEKRIILESVSES